MPELSIYNSSGNEVEKVSLNKEIFEENVNEHVVHEAVTAQLAAKRQGNASTKGRSEVRGGGRKPWRQKGTGRARHGSIRSPLWVGGGITFGPKPRSYKKKINRKTKKLAIRSVLTAKANAEELLIIDELSFDRPRTKDATEILSNLNLSDKKVLFVLPEKDKNAYLSIRNIANAKTMVLDGLNVYDLLNNDMVVIPQAALDKLEEVLLNG
ncbi:50S ribosomal protein L4 [Halanaerobiaceae bacterium Z-7014]|uniref:Large ribosomal subunit protein uL4 n=1 Tax=Halonatronomonas betaini TaxID=2778430 RepID=A0A931F9W5_9FIRM|nr:50S ribosomal protein L4 [Halonatronomonas betaini]MBF8438013.1 50S ribosomal protein L4 [Halonatronomonas betaini]